MVAKSRAAEGWNTRNALRGQRAANVVATALNPLGDLSMVNIGL
jgi:hypothetical protein